MRITGKYTFSALGKVGKSTIGKEIFNTQQLNTERKSVLRARSLVDRCV